MKRKLLALCLLLTAMLSLSACDKCDAEDQRWTIDTVEATIKWTGNIAADGCGYMLVIGQDRYKPTNENDIPETFKEAGHNGMPVEVTILNYHKTIRTNCGLTSFDINSAKILELRKR